MLLDKVKFISLIVSRFDVKSKVQEYGFPVKWIVHILLISQRISKKPPLAKIASGGLYIIFLLVRMEEVP